MRKFNLILTRSLILTLLAVFTSTLLNAQSLSGSGTQKDPYKISNPTDWYTFAKAVSDGHTFDGEYLEMTNDITVNITNTDNQYKFVGTWQSNDSYKPFSGTFDGNGKTLTFNVGSVESPYTQDAPKPKAPFRSIDGATFKNMHVTGKIVSTSKYNSGLVGFAYSKKYGRINYFTNCISSIEIDCTNITANSSDCSSAGFVAENKKAVTNSELQFENCIFDGYIYDTRNPRKAIKAAGFVAYTNNDNHKPQYMQLTNCLMAGTIDIDNTNLYNDGTFNTKTFTRTYNRITYNSGNLYTHDYSGIDKSKVNRASLENSDGVYKKYTILDTNYYVPVTVSPELHDMFYTAPVVVSLSYYGKTLVKDTDYTILIEKKNGGEYETVSEITGPTGAYRVTITGKTESDFVGSKVYTFRFLSEDERWQILVEAIAAAASGSTITLPNNYIADSGDEPLLIPAGKTLTINLNGNTIDRNLSAPVNYGQVIRIEAGATLNIIGPGTITGGNSQAVDNVNEQGSKNDAGGIYNMGTLTLTNVTVENNRCCKNPDDPTNDKATARGGGIYTGLGSSFTMTGGKVTGNAAKGGGGGVYCYYPASFSMTNVEISNNDSESKGGGLRIRTNGTPLVEATLTNCTVRNCRATETNLTRSSDGGGIYMQEGKLRMENCTIGGIDITNPGTPEADTTFYTNQSAFAGAGFYQNSGETYAKNCNISYNSAYTQHDKMYGGGICLKAGTYTMDDGEITNNHSYKNGGGVYIYPGARFNVKGKILIDDNFRTRPGAVPEDTDNNTYLEGNAQIHIIGDLHKDARIHITGHGLGGVYTEGLEEHATLDNFVTDGKYQLLNTWDPSLTEIKMVPYDWYKVGTWDETTQPHETPTASSSVVINRAFELEEGEIGYADSIRFVAGRIIIRDGAQLICYTQSTATPIEALIEKSIKAVEDDYGWYSISAPIDDVLVFDEWEHSTNLKTKSSAFDLLRYHEPTHFWDSYSDNSSYQSQFGNFTQTEKGRGYLYRNENDMTITYQGNIELGNVAVNVTAKGDKLTGFNLIGNPYTHTIYKGDGTAIPNGDLLKSGFYTLTRQGAWVAKADNTDSISICQGILVQANDDGAIPMTNTISKGSSKAGKNSVSFTVANGKYEDVAYAMIDKGSGLNKIEHLNEDIPMVYIRHNDEDYAVAVLNEATRAFNLCFQTNTTGRYTLKVKVDGEFRYLHLLDCITGEDIDLLKDNEYSFIASNVDDENRFVVLLGDNTGADDSFAFQNGDDLIVSGNGELQIFDVAGRMVSRQMVNGVEIVHTPYRTGVYILRLVGSEIKTQKIVVK